LRMICSGLFLCLFTCFGPPLPIVAGGKDSQTGRTDFRGSGHFHQARHTYASFMIAAGVNPKALSAFMGHSSIKVTFDLYGHLMPGTEAEAAALLDRFLDT